jgi:hypothetical protein
VPTSEPSGNTVSGFDSVPDAGDIVDAYITDSIASGWIRASVASSALGSAGCPAYPQAHGTLSVALREPVSLPQGAILRFSRPMRLSHYRATDGQWYFGVRDWSASALRLNTIQPVAGPLDPHSSDPNKSGLVLRYFDNAGSELPAPVDATKIVSISVTVRSRTQRPVLLSGRVQSGMSFLDSATTTVALRNAQ